MALQELIYTSVATGPADSDLIAAILASSEKNNVAAEVTGLLMFDGERYIQILEGETDRVDDLFDVIEQDSRHTVLEILHKGSIKHRSFENWRMAYEALPPGLLGDLAENMAVYSMELNGAELEADESFGAKLNGMFMDAMAAE